MNIFWKKLIPWIGLSLATQSLVLWRCGMEYVVIHNPKRGIVMLFMMGIELILSIIAVIIEMIIQAKKTK